MLTFALAFACYQTNSSFVYNPILKQGVLTASFINSSETLKYEICKRMAGHLVRAKVAFLAEYQQSLASISTIRHYAVSSTYFFEMDKEISVTLVAESAGAHVAALRTQLSSFVIEAMDLDANVDQTLGSYSVNDFHYNECLQNITTTTGARKLMISVLVSQCDISLTRIGHCSGRDQIKDEMVRASVTTGTYGTLSIDAGLDVYYAQAGITEKLFVEFDCAAIALQNKANGDQCDKIVNFLAKHTDFDCTFKLDFALQNSSFYQQFWVPVAAIMNAKYPSCITSTYVVNVDFIMIYYTIKDTQECDTSARDGYYFQGTLQPTTMFTGGERFFFNQSVVLQEGQERISVQCTLQPDVEACRDTLRYFTLLGSEILKFRVFHRFPDSTEQFMTALSTRTEFCFLNVEAYLAIDSATSEEGEVNVKLIWTGLDKCDYQAVVRSQLIFRLVKLVEPNGRYAQSEKTPLLEIQLTEGFSVANATILFTCTECKDVLKQAAALLEKRQLFSYLFIDGMEVPVNSIYDNIIDVNSSTYAGVAVALGALFAVGGVVVNLDLKRRHKKRTVPVF